MHGRHDGRVARRRPVASAQASAHATGPSGHPLGRQGPEREGGAGLLDPGPATGGKVGRHDHRRGEAARAPAHGQPPGKPGHVAGGLPAGRGRRYPSHRASTPEAFPYPYPYDSFTPSSALWPTYPYKVNGKLFFTNNGGSFVCSATAVASASGTSNENEIWTAGHCLVNTEPEQPERPVVDSSAVFIPAYNGNVSNFDPYGEFVWNGGWDTSSAWYHNSDLTEDEAAMTVGTSSTTGRTLGQVRGLGRIRLELARQRAVRRLRVPGRVAVQRPQHGRGHRRDRRHRTAASAARTPPSPSPSETR